MRTCYVALPFSTKPDTTGRPIDFDAVYREVIQPAVLDVGIDCRRLGGFDPGTVLHKTLFSAILGSDLVIADLSSASPNVLYELGVRHALRRGRTLVVAVGGNQLPSSVAYTQAIWYEPDASGRLTGEPAARFRNALQAAIRQSQQTAISDSLLYDFFPDLEVMLPAELQFRRLMGCHGADVARPQLSVETSASPFRDRGCW